MSVEYPFPIGEKMRNYLERSQITYRRDPPEVWSRGDHQADHPLGRRAGSVPAVHQVVIVYHWLEAGLYHQQAYGPVGVGEDDFDGMHTAVLRAERRFKLDHHQQIQVLNVSAYVLDPI